MKKVYHTSINFEKVKKFSNNIKGYEYKIKNRVLTSSTNILKFIENFENDDESWIDEINSKL